MNPSPEADRVLLAHMRNCLDRILEYTNAERLRFETSVEQDLPALSKAVNRVLTQLGPSGQ